MPEIQRMVEEALGYRLPPTIDDGSLETAVRSAVTASGRIVVALDDDPTGVQTVHDVAVLADWEVRGLADELERPESLFFILTNSRSLPEEKAAALNREIATNLREAGERTGREFVAVSRSDSTLRGHFPAETDALADVIGDIDGAIVCPAFFEGGRVSAGDIHFVREGDRVFPAAETEFARDATFGYGCSALPEWVAEKSRGRWTAGDVARITLDDIRLGGAARVAEILSGVQGRQPVIVNALDYADLWTVVLGLLQAEDEGKRFLYRTGASFVRARAGISERPLLKRDELLTAQGAHSVGVVIVGSHVRRSTEQLARLLGLPGVIGIEVRVRDLLGFGEGRQAEIARVRDAMNAALAAGATPAVFTSREPERPGGRDELEVARSVSDALVAIVAGITERTDFIIGKGGITSSDVGTRGLGASRATVLGQIRPGVPVWRLGPESRFPGMPYVVFPGNVGGPETLAEIVRDLVGPGSHAQSG